MSSFMLHCNVRRENEWVKEINKINPSHNTYSYSLPYHRDFAEKGVNRERRLKRACLFNSTLYNCSVKELGYLNEKGV